MRPLTQEEVAAMWLWREEYAAGRDGAIEFYRKLGAGRKESVAEFLTLLGKAKRRRKR